MANLLEKIEAALAIEQDLVKCAELSARKALYLSRVGRFAEAKIIVSSLRHQYGDGHNPIISVWIILAEGVADFFENLGARARDRISRAYLLGVAIGDRRLAAITSSWKAHIEFESSNFDSMAKALKVCLDNIDDDNNDAKTRFEMIIANCLFLCGDREKAQKWFLLSRDSALKIGDQATIDALIYNRAAFAMARLRAERCTGAVDQREVARIHLELTSAKNYQEIAGIGAVNHFVDLCLARALILEEKFDLALEALAAVRSVGPFAAYNFSLALIDLEMAFCLSKLGRTLEASEKLSLALGADYTELDVDDRLVVVWLFSEMRRETNSIGQLENISLNINEVSDEYDLIYKNLRRLVLNLVDEIA